MQQQYIKLRGVLIPVDWDSNGNTIALAVATNEEEEYFINPADTPKELFSMLQEEVEVAGWYRRQQGERNMISPDSYRVIGTKNKNPTKKKPLSATTEPKERLARVTKS